MKKEKMILVPAAFLMTAMLAFPVMASERIEEVTIDISAVLTDSDNLEVEAEVSDDGCYVDEVTVTNTPSGDWNDSTKPKVKVTLGAESGYTFSTGLGRSDVYLGNDDQTVTSVSRSTSKLSVYVTLPKIEDIDTDYDSDDDLEVYDLFWDDSYGGVACWEGSDSAKKYQVRLYRDGSAVGSTYTTTNDYYNFCGSFTKSGSYTFKVKAIRGNNETSWQESDSKDVNSSEASAIYANRTAAAKYYGSGSSGSNNQTSSSSSSTADGAWLRDGNGWWWCNPNRSYPYSVWAMIEGKWYYFNEQGYCVMNDWVHTGGKWYYCGESGAMVTSQMINGQYYVNINGEWVQ